MATTAKSRVRTLRIEDITADESIQQRADGISPVLVAEYAGLWEQGVEFPPVVVYDDGKTKWLSQGFHRIAAAAEVWELCESIKAEVRKGTKRDAILDACGANADHGQRRTNADKREAVLTLLEDSQWSKRSSRWIAERCAVHHDLVDQIRVELAESANSHSGGNGESVVEATASTRIGRDGKRYKGKRNDPPVTIPPSVRRPIKSYAATDLFDKIAGAFCGLTARAMTDYGSLAKMIDGDKFNPHARDGAVDMLRAMRQTLDLAIKELES